jgi:hypothetical protein
MDTCALTITTAMEAPPPFDVELSEDTISASVVTSTTAIPCARKCVIACPFLPVERRA